MSRVKGGLMAQKRRRNILEQVKGYRLQRSKKKRVAREAIYHAETYAFAHRKDKKADFRRLWTVRINAALNLFDIKYSRFIKSMSDKGIKLDRKVLATLAKDRPDSFARVVEATK
ncbi:50S ribosomal protein L20 [Candidatus Kaiserbacteria bacterium RIFOXYD1_FULL_42_15]|uniref:Large ribosomal subunit protein bL20 n=1 Tax=Candidatus Kaiserbacteria bacterium RIFOXYD1_FULL_42_15 TaxID=1798532 RepID=A0A1F6FSD9_9BACT|nr:MAG: 50S ribosomal protein L20 [Candidatus Kaiserbacteria bacterium RIFOXYD1_FULL_42_15]